MSTRTIEVRSRIFGQTHAEPQLEPVILELLEERITVAELIRRVVEEQVRTLIMRRKLDALTARRALDRQYAAGRPGYAVTLDPAAEVQRALQAFETGTYFILVDRRRVARLDEVIAYGLDTKVSFLRCMPLVGG